MRLVINLLFGNQHTGTRSKVRQTFRLRHNSYPRLDRITKMSFEDEHQTNSEEIQFYCDFNHKDNILVTSKCNYVLLLRDLFSVFAIIDQHNYLSI